jgi:hypothetical protein
VLFYPLAAVGLECTFRHGNSRTPDWQNGIKTNSEYKGRKQIPAIQLQLTRMNAGKSRILMISFLIRSHPRDPREMNCISQRLRASAVDRILHCTILATFTLRALDNFFAEAFRVETFLIYDEKVFHTGKSFVLGC